MPILVFQHSPICGSLRLGEKLRDYGANLRLVELCNDEPVPGDLIGVDGVISMGGSLAPDDDAPSWMEPEMALIRSAHEAELPVIGICLGCQIVARALGGETGELDGGLELGWHDVSFTPIGREDPVHAGLGWSWSQFHWHRYYVSELPPGAKVLATSERCPVQAWSMGVRTYGYQFHPEIRPGTWLAWNEDDPSDLNEAGVSIDALQRETHERFPTFARLTDRLFEQWALLVLAPDRRYAGVVKDLHH